MTKKKKGIFGDYYQHETPRGERDGISIEKESLLGEKYIEHRDRNGKLIGQSKQEESLLGAARTTHRDSHGNKTGSSVEDTNIFGDKVVNHFDHNGHQVGQSKVEQQIFGGETLVTRGGSAAQRMGAGVRAVTGATTTAATGLGAGMGGVFGGLAATGPIGLGIALILGFLVFSWIAGLIFAMIIPGLIAWKSPLKSVVILVPLLITVTFPLVLWYTGNGTIDIWEIVLGAVLWPIGAFHAVSGNFSDPNETQATIIGYFVILTISCVLSYFADTYSKDNL